MQLIIKSYLSISYLSEICVWFQLQVFMRIIKHFMIGIKTYNRFFMIDINIFMIDVNTLIRTVQISNKSVQPVAG